MPSQWALQYFDPSVGTQLQAAFAHFFLLAMAHHPICSGHRPGTDPLHYRTDFERREGMDVENSRSELVHRVFHPADLSGKPVHRFSGGYRAFPAWPCGIAPQGARFSYRSLGAQVASAQPLAALLLHSRLCRYCGYTFVTSPSQSLCPQWQTTSVRSSAPAQYALQYFDPSAGMQSQGGFAHFSFSAILSSPLSVLV